MPVLVTAGAVAQDTPSAAPEFSHLVRVLGYSTWREYAAGGPTNRVGETYDRRMELNVRPDLALKGAWWDASIKPRLDIYDEQRGESAVEGDDSDADLYVYEWKARLRLPARTSVAYGRENKQWGPSYLLSPSNPFLSENGRNSPKSEIDAADYAQADWVVNAHWSVSAIANTDEGRRDIPEDDLERVYALKADWTGPGVQASLIGSFREEGEERAGWYGTWYANDALILYQESGWQEEDAELLFGMSYTTADGGTFGVEYFFNEGGEPDADAAGLINRGARLPAREGFLREHYLLAQYLHPMWMERVDLTLRWIYNADDQSHATVALADIAVHDRAELFVNGILFSGDEASEFGAVLDHRLQAGVEITF